MQLYETPHSIESGLYYKQFLQQRGGLPHFTGRVHVRTQKGLGLSGGGFFTKLIPMGLITKKIGQAVVPKLIKAVPTEVGKRIVKRVAPKLVRSAVYNARDVMSGKKDVVGAVKDTVWKNRGKILRDAYEAATGEKVVRASKRKAPRKAPKYKRRKKRMKLFGGNLIPTSRVTSQSTRGVQKKKTNYLYGDVFDRLSS